MKKTVKAMINEFRKGLAELSKLERLFWIVIILLILTFGFKSDIKLLSVAISTIILLGVIALGKDKSIALTITTLLFVIWTISIQQRQLESQLDGLQNQFQFLKLDEKFLKLLFDHM